MDIVFNLILLSINQTSQFNGHVNFRLMMHIMVYSHSIIKKKKQLLKMVGCALPLKAIGLILILLGRAECVELAAIQKLLSM